MHTWFNKLKKGCQEWTKECIDLQDYNFENWGLIWNHLGEIHMMSMTFIYVAFVRLYHVVCDLQHGVGSMQGINLGVLLNCFCLKLEARKWFSIHWYLSWSLVIEKY
jgi:hypothetical protein